MLEPMRLILYSRPGCHLCHVMLDDLAPVARRLGLEVAEVDVSEDPALVAAYGDDVPVLKLGADLVVRHRATRDEIAERLQEIIARREPS